MIDEAVKEKLRTQTVEVLLEIRSAYLRTSGVSVLKHWDQIQDRLRASARTTTGPEEWATSMARSLRLDSPNLRYSESLLALTHEVHDRKCANEWLELLEREYAFLIVMTRAMAEQRKEAREAQAT